MSKYCEKCGKKLGFLSGTNVGGKWYCDGCQGKIPRTYLDYECYQCRYAYQSGGEYYCRKNNDKYIGEGSHAACSSFSK